MLNLFSKVVRTQCALTFIKFYTSIRFVRTTKIPLSSHNRILNLQIKETVLSELEPTTSEEILIHRFGYILSIDHFFLLFILFRFNLTSDRLPLRSESSSTTAECSGFVLSYTCQPPGKIKMASRFRMYERRPRE